MNISLPDCMTVIEITEPGAPEVLKPAQRPLPQPGPKDILIQVAAAGVNRPDCLQRQGSYLPPPGASDLPGLEVAGVVVARGDQARTWKLGDKVCALANGGGYAEYCAVPAGQCLPIPAGLDLLQAASLPETYFTVWSNVFERAGLRTGETFLIHGGSSGIGSTAIQLARAWGVRVFATAGSSEKLAFCQELGTERAINYREEDFVAVVKEATGGRGVDVILDMVGGDYVARNLKALAVEGRLTQVAFLKSAKMELNLMPVLLKRLTFTGATLRPRSNTEKALIARNLQRAVWPLFEQKRLRTVIHQTFPLAEAAKAHRLMESSQHMGKLVLTVNSSIEHRAN